MENASSGLYVTVADLTAAVTNPTLRPAAGTKRSMRGHVERPRDPAMPGEGCGVENLDE
jgi:hypothetical protein